MMRRVLSLRPKLLRLLLPLLAALALGAWSAPPVGAGPGPAKGQSTGWPVPRFETLRSNEAHLRAGPGFQYPILWVFHRAGLPVEVIGEFNVWRHVVMPDGSKGWLHEALLRSTHNFIVTAKRATLRRGPNARSGAAAYLDKGVVGLIRSCRSGSAWCKVLTHHHSGYLRRSQIWGLFPGQTIK